MATNDALNTLTVPIPVSKGGTNKTSTTVNRVLYSSATNVIDEIASAASCVMITSAGGVPSLSQTLPSGVITNVAPPAPNYVVVAMTAADIQNMYATPVLMIAAPGAGKIIRIASAAIEKVYTGTPFSGGGTVNLQYLSTANGLGENLTTSLISSGNMTASSSIFCRTNGSSSGKLATTTAVNAAVYISNITAAFTSGGTNTVNVHIYYSIVTTGM